MMDTVQSCILVGGLWLQGQHVSARSTGFEPAAGRPGGQCRLPRIGRTELFTGSWSRSTYNRTRSDLLIDTSGLTRRSSLAYPALPRSSIGIRLCHSRGRLCVRVRPASDRPPFLFNPHAFLLNLLPVHRDRFHKEADSSKHKNGGVKARLGQRRASMQVKGTPPQPRRQGHVALATLRTDRRVSGGDRSTSGKDGSTARLWGMPNRTAVC